MSQTLKNLSDGEPAGVSVVVPVFNSAGTLRALVGRLAEVVPTLSPAHELILVNDGSGDDSWPTIEALAVEYSWVRGLSLMKNYGQHNAVLCGVRAARYSVIATLDDDLQNPPEELPKILSRLTGDVDVVYGTPEEEPHGVWRNLASRITKIALRTAMGPETAKTVNTFRVFRTRLRDAFADYHSPLVSVDVLLTWGASRFATVKVKYDSRAAGRSNYTFGKLVMLALNMATGFSTVPLRLASIMGLAFTGLGVVLFGFVVFRYLTAGDPVPGFPFLASIITVFSGAQLFALGIIGEYLGRTYLGTMSRPAYVVRHSTHAADPTSGRGHLAGSPADADTTSANR